jgi:hypothetical protein
MLVTRLESYDPRMKREQCISCRDDNVIQFKERYTGSTWKAEFRLWITFKTTYRQLCACKQPQLPAYHA